MAIEPGKELTFSSQYPRERHDTATHMSGGDSGKRLSYYISQFVSFYFAASSCRIRGDVGKVASHPDNTIEVWRKRAVDYEVVDVESTRSHLQIAR